MIDILILIIIFYLGMIGYKTSGLRQLGNMVAYFFAFILSRFLYSIFSNSLTIFIFNEHLKDKIAFLIAFLMISYFFKILLRIIENIISIKLKKHYTGFIFGMINSILIISLCISVFKEVFPNTINVHNTLYNKSILYQKLDALQKSYLIQYKNSEE